MTKTIDIIKHTGDPNSEFALKQTVRLYANGENKRDVRIDLINELEGRHGVKTYEVVLGSGSEKYTAPDGYGLVCVGANFTSINEKGNSVHHTEEIIAAYKL